MPNAISLYKVEQDRWAITGAGSVREFSNIEAASAFLSYAGILNDAIDMALGQLAIHGDSCAEFGIYGNFTVTTKRTYTEVKNEI